MATSLSRFSSSNLTRHTLPLYLATQRKTARPSVPPSDHVSIASRSLAAGQSAGSSCCYGLFHRHTLVEHADTSEGRHWCKNDQLYGQYAQVYFDKRNRSQHEMFAFGSITSVLTDNRCHFQQGPTFSHPT